MLLVDWCGCRASRQRPAPREFWRESENNAIYVQLNEAIDDADAKNRHEMAGFLSGFCVIVVVGAAVSIVQVWLACGPVLPAGSVALTLKGCCPGASVPRSFGETHDANAPASSLQAKLLCASPAEKEKLGVTSLLGSGGLAENTTAGGVVSTVHVELISALVLPAASVALTANVWRPSAIPL